jgi:hypothetical protein
MVILHKVYFQKRINFQLIYVRENEKVPSRTTLINNITSQNQIKPANIDLSVVDPSVSYSDIRTFKELHRESKT